MSSSAIRFGVFELRPDSNELFKGGSKIKLKPQAARVLGILARRAGEAVAREEIRSALWGADTFVDFDASLNSCITQLRAALGDDPEAPRFIETVPRHGYRFVGPGRRRAAQAGGGETAKELGVSRGGDCGRPCLGPPLVTRYSSLCYTPSQARGCG